MSEWRQPKGTHTPRGLSELLNNIPQLLGPVIAPAGCISSVPLTASSSPTDVSILLILQLLIGAYMTSNDQ